ncbi:non-specific lipid-transfer protein-like protein [Cocos nucifera]|uniref:Non-specific lipid-transfer protein-like protein n=1 Tax=Cocos nucifera TaxID=13894 RepID=A0A8K0HZG3_COCNU|nr:non-specific lipid-transfer protein-like protein [Cocos nucifera]
MDCSSALDNLVDCATFAEEGSQLTKPQGQCCSGLKKVIKEDLACLCDTFMGNPKVGATLNMTKALTLPSACGISTPPRSMCKSGSLSSFPLLNWSISVVLLLSHFCLGFWLLSKGVEAKSGYLFCGEVAVAGVSPGAAPAPYPIPGGPSASRSVSVVPAPSPAHSSARALPVPSFVLVAAAEVALSCYYG